MTERIEILIIKYFSESLSEQEHQELLSWIETGKNKKALNDYISLNYTIELLKNDHKDDSQIWNHIKTSIKKPTRKLNYWKYAAAASVLLIVALTIFFNRKDKPHFVEPIIVNNNIKTGTDKATLTLETEEEVTLVKGTYFQIQNATSNGEEIIYNNNTSRELVYNHLTVPRGGQFQLTLSDGTRVWLNSETQLKYPISFTDGKSRQVELVYGEAYFDVSPSIEHQGSNFKVIHNAQQVQVLGTEFNIKAYEDETNVFTTLVEGEVAINVSDKSTVLAPGQQSNLDKVTKSISITVVDIFNETSWKDGIFSFDNKSLNNLMQVLTRWYDMEVVFENKALKNIKFFGKLKKSQGIEEILAAIKNSSAINNYEINNKTIILK